MQPSLDLDAYLERIGYEGPRAPTLATLQALHRLHPAAIAFESLDPLLGRVPALGLRALEAKLVAGRRGGYCYEHNTLFKAALEALGFGVTALAARVLWGVAPLPADPRPRTHMLLKVELQDGPVIADVGFGGLVMTAPLRLEPGPVQPTHHEAYRLTEADGDLRLEAELGPDDWRALYAFTLEPQLAPDLEMMNWFTTTHPGSPFLCVLMAARATAEERATLADNRLTLRRKGQPSEERRLGTVEELAQVLRGVFAIEPPDDLGRLAGRVGLSP